LLLGVTSLAHSDSSSDSDSDHEARIYALHAKWNYDYPFSGLASFAHLPYHTCILDPDLHYDIAILGLPFDTSTSYRPGARFGPRAIRTASARQTPYRSSHPVLGINPYRSWATVMDCGDLPITPFDNGLAMRQMEEGISELLRGPARLVALGGDHSIILPALRALRKKRGRPVAVLHFDAHLDTWDATKYPSEWKPSEGAAQFTHGTMLNVAASEGLLDTGHCVHAGLRTRLSGQGWEDYENDETQGWVRVPVEAVDEIGVKGVVAQIVDVLKGREVYLSVDIDVIDPGMAPGTGTPEIGGWTTRELLGILRGVLKEIDIVGVDVVEVAPAYDHAETTALAAAGVIYEILSGMVKKG
ncbi:agmatinase, mitochondrial precursor, partial [Geopyxis carbonaria]